MTTLLNSAPSNQPAMRLRIAGLVIAGSTPITGILLYAIVATLVGEGSLEGSQGLTALGWSAITAPVILGLAAIALSYTNVLGYTKLQGPSRRTSGLVAGALSVAFLGLGIWSIVAADPGDASIGGGLLVLAAIPLAVVSGVLLALKGRGEMAGS